jgi:hypothetical protein
MLKILHILEIPSLITGKWSPVMTLVSCTCRASRFWNGTMTTCFYKLPSLYRLQRSLRALNIRIRYSFMTSLSWCQHIKSKEVSNCTRLRYIFFCDNIPKQIECCTLSEVYFIQMTQWFWKHFYSRPQTSHFTDQHTTPLHLQLAAKIGIELRTLWIICWYTNH